MVTGSSHTHLARSWLGTEDLDGVMSLDEDIRSSTGNQEPTRWIQHLEHICSTAQVPGSVLDVPYRGGGKTTESTSYRQADLQ